MRPIARRLARAQAAYLLATGAAPFVSMRAFQRVTGPKTDDWLVRTVGLLAVGFGAVLGRDAARGRPDALTGVAAALPFAAASGWYGGTGRISRVYLADAAVELAFVAAWLVLAAAPRERDAGPVGRARAASGAAFPATPSSRWSRSPR